MKYDLKIMPEKLKKIRTQKKLRQRDVAEKIGVTYQSYQAYELGRSVPTLENYLKLCETLGVGLDELLS